MAKECSFDIVSEFDKQELVNAVDQVKREITSRFDLKNSNSDVVLEADKTITITTNDDMKLRNIIDILQSKMVKRNLSIKILDPQPVENALGGNVRQVFKLKKGLTQELAKKIVADIKASKIKVQASIQGEQVRVSGKDKDDLQAVIKMLRGNEDAYDVPLQYQNYRS
ncbi:YajQ family cyclic di-GMP-binding protein [bacterium]|nr:YajQ family cyclic di-GMP-binding protein [bacterium]